jgi:hypothetical protein
MPQEVKMAKVLHDTSIQGFARAAKRERAFDLSLPALVKGLDARGKRFEERTETCSISAQEISFCLKSRLLIGTKVSVSLDIPRTLILERPLRLLVAGAVVHVRFEEGNGQRQVVALQLDRSFRLHPETISPA